MALIVVGLISSLGAGYLMLSRSLTRKSSADLEISQSFYLAEAGLAEAFNAVRIGRSGQIGSETQPCAYGNGHLWVDASNTVDGHVELRSTAAVGAARSSLALTVEPTEIELGFFSDEDLVIESVLLTDGFDSEQGSYTSQVSGKELVVDPSYPYLMVDEQNGVLFYDGLFYRFVGRNGDSFMVDQSMDFYQANELGESLDGDYNFNGFVTADHYDGYDPWATKEYAAIVDYLTSQPYQATLTDTGEVATSVLGPTTGGGGLLASNGEVLFADPNGIGEVFGDIESGPYSATSSGTDVQVTGDWTTRDQDVELPPVTIPDVPFEGSLVHDGLLPMLVSPGTVGYSKVEVATDAQLVLRGPATVVIGQLTLAPGASLELDTRNGNVDLYVTDGMDLQPGSLLTTPGQAPDELSVQVSPIQTVGNQGAPVKLESTASFYGTIYSPGSDVHIGSDFEIFGAVAAKKLTVASGARLHFDNSGLDGSPIPRIVSWKIVETPDIVRNRRDIVKLLGLDRASLLRPSEAHDLAAVMMTIRYLDKSGLQRQYSGSEADFDWSQVGEVLQVSRNADRPGEGGSADDPDPLDPNAVRSEVQGWLDLGDASGWLTGGEVFCDSVAAYVPLRASEWDAINAVAGNINATALQDLRDSDIAAGGTGGL